MAKTKNQKMTTFFIYLIVIGTIITLVGITGYRIYLGKANAEKEQSATDQRQTINDNVSDLKEKVVDNIESSKDEILEKLEEMTSSSYKPLDNEIKREIINNLKILKSENKSFPYIAIEVESGNSQRHKIALELESILTPLELGTYGEGNTFIGRFPDHPISVFYNPSNDIYVKKITGILSNYIFEGFSLISDKNYPGNYMRIYINGIPEFYNDGSLKVK